MPQLLTLDQAAAYLNITDEQIAAFVAGWRARLHQRRTRQEATALRFTKQDLDAFIERRRQKEVAMSVYKHAEVAVLPLRLPSTMVIGFTARRAAQLARKPKPSKP